MTTTILFYFLIISIIFFKGFYNSLSFIIPFKEPISVRKNLLSILTSIEIESLHFYINKKKIDFLNIFIIFFISIFFNLVSLVDSTVFCQGSYIESLSNEDFNTWLKNANDKAHYLNINSLETRAPLIFSIEKDIKKIISQPSINSDLLQISNNIINNWDSLITKNIEYKNVFLQIPMTFQNQEMPVEMYIDSLEFLVNSFKKDMSSINYCTELFEINNINTENNRLILNNFKNITLNNITELQQHTSLINFNILYGNW